MTDRAALSALLELAGKTALVTGASRGIGLATARALAAQGAHVVLNSHEDSEDLAAAVAELAGAGAAVSSEAFDIADSAQVAAGFSCIKERCGGLNILVNNAGRRFDGLAMSMKDEAWQSALDVNLSGAFYCSREALKLMRGNGGGAIINVSSVAAFAGSAGQSNYAAAKAGLIGLTRSLALEYGSRAVRVNCVVPGIIDTSMTSGVKDELKAQWAAQIPLKRFGTADEVAAAIAFLASEAASYITGATLHINGGGYPA